MALTRENKADIISGISKRLGDSRAAFLIDFKGMNVEEVTNLRKKLRANQAEMQVVRNTLAKRALNDHPDAKEALDSYFVGTNAFVYAYEDAAASAKVLLEFSEDVEELELKAGVMGTDGLDAARIKYLATLPSIDVLRAQFLGVLNAPAQKFVGTLAAVPGGFARLLNAYKATKE